MDANKTSLTTLSLLTSFTIAGFGSQIGLLIEPMAAAFGVPVTAAAAQFSWLLGGILVGNILALDVLRRLKLRWAVIAAYVVLFLTMLGAHSAPNLIVVAAAFSVGGVTLGIGVCAASTIITKIWQHRKRGAVLVSQDAFYNTGGILFPMITVALLTSGYSWSWGYLVVGGATLVIVTLAAVTKFGFESDTKDAVADSTQWNPGLTVAGVGLLLVLICQISALIWLPVFLQNKFGVSPQLASAVIPQIFIAALIGSVISAFIVLKVSIHTFLVAAMICGLASDVLFTLAPSMAWIPVVAYLFGLAIAAVYHSFLAWGLTYIDNPNHRHVTFIYICGGIGGMLAPYVSSRVVKWYDEASVFLFCAALYAVVLALMFGLAVQQRKQDTERPMP